MKLWIDDIRRPPHDSWTWVRTNAVAIEILRNNRPEVVSFDHDMGLHTLDPDTPGATLMMGPDKTPDKCCCVVARLLCELDSPLPPQILIHTMNPKGAEDLMSVFTSYWRSLDREVVSKANWEWELKGDPGVSVVVQPYRVPA